LKSKCGFVISIGILEIFEERIELEKPLETEECMMKREVCKE